jgi:predicted Rossmann-fold nucleotide-binding protein
MAKAPAADAADTGADDDVCEQIVKLSRELRKSSKIERAGGRMGVMGGGRRRQ